MQKSETPPFAQITDGVLLSACHVQDLAGLYRGRVAKQVVSPATSGVAGRGMASARTLPKWPGALVMFATYALACYIYN